MRKTTQAMLGILLMITMSLSMGLEGMSVNDENINHTSARGETNCTSDEGCPDGYTCSSDGVCVAEQTCDIDGDCPDGETCEDGTCENTVHESSCEDTNQETNEDGTCGVCLDGYGLDANGDCVEDPSLDNSCTSNADCENGQICGAAGECMDAPDDSGNETDGNETNDGGGEPQYRNCSFEDRWSMMGDGDFNDLELMVCDEDTGEWVDADLDLDRPTSVEIGCDEEPTEEQLDASNFADLLNEHDEILIRDGDVTRLLSTGKMNTSVTLSPFLIAKYELSQVGSNDSDGLEEWSIYLDLDLDTAVGGDGDFDWNDMTVVWHTMVTVITDDSDEDSGGRSNSTFTPKSETVYIISHSFLVSNSTGNDTEGVWGGSLSIEGIVSTGESGGAIIMQRTAIDTSGGGVDECGECWGMEVSIEPNDPDVGNIFLMEKVSYSSTMKSLGTILMTGGSLIIEDAIPWDDSDDDDYGGEVADFRYWVSSSNFQFLYQEHAVFERSEGRNSTLADDKPHFVAWTMSSSESIWSNGSWGDSGGLNLPFTSISNGSGMVIADSVRVLLWSVNLGGTNDGNWLNSENDSEWIYVSLHDGRIRGGTNDGNWLNSENDPEWIYVSLGGDGDDYDGDGVMVMVMKMMSFGNASTADATVCELGGICVASFNGSTVDIGLSNDRLIALFMMLNSAGGNGSGGDLDLMGASAFDQKLVGVNSFMMSVDGGFDFSENLMFADFDNGMRVESIQIGMDENGTVTSAHKFLKECLRMEDVAPTNKDDGNEPEDESSNVLVAAGGVEVTTRDAAVAGVAAATTALLSAVIRRGGGGALRAGDYHSTRSSGDWV